MKTICLPVPGERPDAAAIARAAAVLGEGGIVAFPTETVYGLGADAFNASAMRRIFEAKGRPSDNPLIVHIAELTFLDSLTADFPPIGRTLAHEFWPGPLTLVVPKAVNVPGIVTAGLSTVAVRMPNHPVALSLLRQFGRGVVAPSANISGRPSPTTARHVLDDLDGKIDIVLDSGPTKIGVESTVLDITMVPPVILRKGGLTKEAIERVIGTVVTEPDPHLAARSPGNRYKHYAPHARVILVQKGDTSGLSNILGQEGVKGRKVACIVHSIPDPLADRRVVVRRASPDIELYSHSLFDYLRELDKSGIDVIIVESVPDAGLGAAVMDRLRRAASAATT